MAFGKGSRWFPLLLLCLVAAQSGHAADIQKYDFAIAGAGSGAVEDTLPASAQLALLNGKGAISPFALVERAREDVPRLQTALDSFGYYQNRVAITIAGRPLDDPGLPAALDALAAGSAVAVKAQVSPGPLYHIGTITLKGTVPPGTRQALSIASGDPAVARDILDAGVGLLNHLQEEGYALAKVDGPDATADDGAHTIGVTYTLTPGRQARIGTIRFEGLVDVKQAYARQALTVHSGDLYRPSRIESARQALAGLGVFSGVNARAADTLSADGRVALTFDVQERKRHAITISGLYSTDLGVSLSATWSHRNLLGNGEQLNLTVAGTGLGNASAGLGYHLAAQYIQPWFFAPGQMLEFDLSGIKQQLDAFDQTAQTLAGYVQRKFSPLWTGRAGLSLTHDQVAQEGSTRLYQLIGLPVSATYDSSGGIGALADPTHGLRASLLVTPTQSLGDSNLLFLPVQLSGASYFDISGDGRSVLALRALVASILGGSNLSVPPDQRLYAGGSATVRGYAYQSIGPQFADAKPMGAKSVDAATVEWRQRIGADWGAALFVDAGQASASGAPFGGALRVGAGIGARYYTPIGAVRVDVAAPLNRVRGGSAFEIYIGLGQAF
jgi:translocation and assembly module TamA